jgi:hypothetical protein
VAAHEGKIQRPPGQAHDRHPFQLVLDEEFEQRDAAVEDVLQDEDVGPGLVVAACISAPFAQFGGSPA